MPMTRTRMSRRQRHADDSPSFTAATTAGTYGSFTVGTDGSWSYVLDADDADTDALDAGDNVTETFTVTASDGTTQTVTLSITGSDDVSVISGDTSGAATEAATDVTVTGALSSSDVDADDSPSFTAATTAGTYGSFTVGTDGSWSYVLDADDADTDALDAGDNVTETFTVTASDGTTQTVTLSIAGSDDVSVITGDTSGAATEAATDVTVTGALSIRCRRRRHELCRRPWPTAASRSGPTALELRPGCRRRRHR